MQGLRLAVPPAILPVTVPEAKIHERIDSTDEANDMNIMYLLQTATIMAEQYTRRAFITQTWNYNTNATSPQISIPRPPLQSIIEPNPPDVPGMVFETYNQVKTTIDPSYYFINVIDEPGILIFQPQYWSQLPFFFGWGYPWPWAWGAGGGWGAYGYGGFISPYNGILTFQFVAGYGDTADLVPSPIKSGILQIFGSLYENRESQEIPRGAKQILDPFRVEYI